MVWTNFNDILYIFTDNSNSLHPLAPFLGPEDLYFGLKRGRNQLFLQIMAAQGRSFRLEMVWTDLNGSLYVSTDNSNNLHPLAPFLGPVDLHFGLKKGQKSTIVTNKGGSRSIISIKNGLGQFQW